MLLASRIVKADILGVTVAFGDAEISPNLLSNPGFRAFALAFDAALPTWPTVLADDGLLPCLIFLAPIENMQICHVAGSDTWQVSVPKSDFLARFEAIRRKLTIRAVAKRQGTTAKSVLDALVRPLGLA